MSAGTKKKRDINLAGRIIVKGEPKHVRFEGSAERSDRAQELTSTKSAASPTQHSKLVSKTAASSQKSIHSPSLLMDNLGQPKDSLASSSKKRSTNNSSHKTTTENFIPSGPGQHLSTTGTRSGSPPVNAGSGEANTGPKDTSDSRVRS